MTLPTSQVNPASTRHGWISFGIVSVAVYVSLLDTFIVNLAFPAIGASFPGTGLANLSWVFTGYAIVFAGLLVPAGRIADAVGRKRLFLIGLGLFVLASALCAAATSPLMLVLARVLQGAGAALFTPSALAVILPEFPPERRPRCSARTRRSARSARPADRSWVPCSCSRTGGGSSWSTSRSVWRH